MLEGKTYWILFFFSFFFFFFFFWVIICSLTKNENLHVHSGPVILNCSRERNKFIPIKSSPVRPRFSKTTTNWSTVSGTKYASLHFQERERERGITQGKMLFYKSFIQNFPVRSHRKRDYLVIRMWFITKKITR